METSLIRSNDLHHSRQFLHIPSTRHHAQIFFTWLTYKQIYNKVYCSSQDHGNTKADHIGMDQRIQSVIYHSRNNSHWNRCQERA